MTQKDIIKTDTNLLISASFVKTFLKMNKSETTSQMILSIIKGEEKQEEKQYYQTLSTLTDILNNSKTEQEIQNKLKEKYPQYLTQTTK